MDAQAPARILSPLRREKAPRFRWTPFDTALGTVLAGIALTVVLVVLLRIVAA
jgi:hypothetical protein